LLAFYLRLKLFNNSPAGNLAPPARSNQLIMRFFNKHNDEERAFVRLANARKTMDKLEITPVN
jgi:hypothetical protein